MSIPHDPVDLARLIQETRESVSVFRSLLAADDINTKFPQAIGSLRECVAALGQIAAELQAAPLTGVLRIVEEALAALPTDAAPDYTRQDALRSLLNVVEAAVMEVESGEATGTDLVGCAWTQLQVIQGAHRTIDAPVTAEESADLALQTLDEALIEANVELHSVEAAIVDETVVVTETSMDETQTAIVADQPAAEEAVSDTSTHAVAEQAASNLEAELLATFDVQLDDSDSDADAFTEETAEHCRRINEILEQFILATDDVSILSEARRLVHSIKGSAGTIGRHPVARLAHRMEDLFERIISGQFEHRRDGADLLQCCVDTLAESLPGDPAEELVTLIYERFEELSLPDPTRPAGDELARPIETAAPESSKPIAQPSTPIEIIKERSPAAELPSNVDLSKIELDNIAEISAEMRDVFTEEAEDHLKLIYAAFAQVETEGPTPTIVRDIRRSAHTLKGAAGAVGFRVVSKWSHRMEDLLDRLRDSGERASTETIQLLYDTTDAIQDMVHGEYEPEAMRQRLARLLLQYDGLQETAAAPAAVETSHVANVVVEAAPVATSDPHEIEVDDDLLTFDAVANAAREAEKAPAPAKRQEAASGQMLRVPIERLDALARTVSELVINRTSFEQRMADLIRFVAENQGSVKRLRGISYDLESEFGAKLLGGRKFVVHGGTPGVQGSAPTPAGRADEFDSLEFDRYGDFHVLARSLAEATNDIDTVGNELRSLLGDFDTLLNRQGRLAREAQNRIMRIRMIPLATLATRLHRAVRVVAQEQGKNVVLDIKGENVELDKLVLEEIADPLLHLLRNAVDHGIETPAIRAANSKPSRATIRIHAYHQGTQVVLRIQDDGKGLDYDRIRETAIRTGVLSKTEADCSTEEDLQQLIFVAGFTTASQVSEISGRGVGMDVVRDKVQKLKGTIDIDSQPGKGTAFTIRLPMTMAVTRALMVSANQETFALPIQVVQQILRIERKELGHIGEDAVLRIKGQAYPVVRLADRLNLRHRGETQGETVPALIVSAGDRTVAVIVDRILSSRDIVVKTLGNHLRQLRGLIGATLMGDGTVVPILDPLDLVGAKTERFRGLPKMVKAAGGQRERTASNQALTVMIVDDSVSVRRVMSNLIKNAGLIPIVAKDGVDALEVLQSSERAPDIFLLDIEMPRMDGYELLTTLRGQPQHRDTPIVMITSRAGEKHRTKAFQLGVNEYLTKPFRDDDLLNTIRRLTKRESTLV